VRLQPRSSGDKLEGVKTLSDGRPVLIARVRAVPEDGHANDALLRLVARELGLPPSACTLSAGAKSRIKTLAIAGDPEAVERKLEAICGPAKD